MESIESAVELQNSQRGKLLKILGITFGIAVTIGGMIGLGILRTPGAVAGQLGNVWLILGIWVLGGVYAILGTIAVAELSTSLPTAGGWYVYARRAFGDYGGFIVGWSDWLSSCATIAFVAITFGEYLPKLFPQLSGGINAIALTTLLIFGLLNWLGWRVRRCTCVRLPMNSKERKSNCWSLIRISTRRMRPADCFLICWERSTSLKRRAERKIDGINKAKQKGVKFGAARKLTVHQIEELREKRKDGVLIKHLMAEYKLSKASVYRYLEDQSKITGDC